MDILNFIPQVVIQAPPLNLSPDTLGLLFGMSGIVSGGILAWAISH